MVKSGIEHHVEDEEGEAFPFPRRELGLEGSPDSGASGRSGGSGASTKAELYERAKEQGIEGRSAMSKEQLESALGER